MFNWNDFMNDFPYTNFSDINVSWFLNKFKQIFDEWEGLYNQLQSWKTATDEYNANWRAEQEQAFTTWENNFQSAIDDWKAQTESDIGTWETDTIATLEAWKAVFINQYNALKLEVEQIAEDAETAKNSAQASASSAQASADSASATATALEASLTQINENTNDISDLKTQISDINGVIGTTITPGKLQISGVVEDTLRSVTDYIPVIGGSTVICKGYVNSSTPMMVGYDKYLTPVIAVTNPAGISTNDPYEIALPVNTAFIRLCFLNSAGIPDTFFAYKVIGVPTETRPGTYVRTGADTTTWRCTYTGRFEANDELSVPGGTCDPRFIPYTGEHTVTIRFPKENASSQHLAAGWVTTNMTVTPHKLQSIQVGAGGNDNSNTYVRTLKRALDSGAEVINFVTSLNGNISSDHDVTINGNGNILYGSVSLTLSDYNSIKRSAYTADERITACYIDETSQLKWTVSGQEYKGYKYGIMLFAGNTKLEPVETVADVENTSDSFCWNDGYFYINTTALSVRYVTEDSNSFTNVTVTINDLILREYYSHVVYGTNSVLYLNGCGIRHSVNQNAICAIDSTLNAQKCECSYVWNDGINCHGRGHSTIMDCYCHDCGDDGCSQHDNTVGVIIGGEFTLCGKAGIASPTNSAKIDIYSAYIHDVTSDEPTARGRGIWASASDGTSTTFRVFNCVIKNNSLGVRVNGHTALLYGNKFDGNDTDVNASGGSVVYLD